MNLDEEVEKVRQELRDGRIKTVNSASESINGSSFDTEGFSGSDHREESGISQFVHRPDAKTGTGATENHDSERSTYEKSFGVGSTDGRSSQNSRSTPSIATATGKRRRGKLEASDGIPKRKTSKQPVPVKTDEAEPVTGRGYAFTKEAQSKPLQRGKAATEDRAAVGEGKAEKQGFKSFKLPRFQKGTTLSLSEAKALEEPLIHALLADSYYLDQFLWSRTGDENQTPIWSNMDTEDCTKLAELMIKRGQSSPSAAMVVRGMVNSSAYFDAVMIVGPRFIKTVEVLKNAPKRARPGLLERKRMVRNAD